MPRAVCGPRKRSVALPRPYGIMSGGGTRPSMQDRTQYQDHAADGSEDWPCFCCQGVDFLRGNTYLECGWRRDELGFPIHPQRCPSHNQAFMRWKRGQDWKRGVASAKELMPHGRKRLFMITWTDRDERWLAWPRPNVNTKDGGLNYGLPRSWDLVPPQIERFRRMRRTKEFLDLMPAGMWVAECTEGYQTRDFLDLTEPDTYGTAEVWWKVHPHIHTLCYAGGTSQGIDLPRLRRLAHRYGFGEPDVKYIHPSKTDSKVGYLVNYLGKDQLLNGPPATGSPIRSRDTWGNVRTACASSRKLRKQELAAERSDQRSE